MGFSRQEYCSELLCPSPGDLFDPGITPTFPTSPALQADSLPAKPSGKPKDIKKKPQLLLGMGAGIVETNIIKQAAHQWEDNYNCKGPSPGMRGSKPHTGFPALESYNRKGGPWNIWLWMPVGLVYGEPEGCRKQTLLLKYTRKLLDAKSQHRGDNFKGARVEKTYWPC